MKHLFLTRMTLVIMALMLCLPLTARAKEKSVIVGFHQKPGPSEKALIHGAKGIIKRTFHLIPAMAVKVSEKEIEKIKKNKKVAYVEEDAIFRAIEPIPGSEYAHSWGVFHIYADIAHAAGNRGAGVSVAVLDTGIDYTHEDLDDNYRGGYDFVFNDADPFDDSTRSHGTHVAGIIAAEDNDPDKGVIGVAPEADLYAVKVLDGGGFGLLSWIVAGIEWSVINGIDIVNMSLEGLPFESLKAACDSAYDAGVLLVAAGGNTNGGAVRYPAAYDSVIAVTGTDADNIKAYFSPIGPEVELAAPGVDILSTIAGGGFNVLSGTSQAAPHVAGTAALFLASNPEDMNGDGFVNDEIRQKLQMTAMDLGDPGPDDIFGYGRVDAAAAVPPSSGLPPFTIYRTSGSPGNDTVTVSLSEAVFQIRVQNNDLKKVHVDVFEGDSYLKELSSSIRFAKDEAQEVLFCLNTTGTMYDVYFTPSGKSGTSAEVMITERGACIE
jgi:subtilisin